MKGSHGNDPRRNYRGDRADHATEHRPGQIVISQTDAALYDRAATTAPIAMIRAGVSDAILPWPADTYPRRRRRACRPPRPGGVAQPPIDPYPTAPQTDRADQDVAGSRRRPCLLDA